MEDIKKATFTLHTVTGYGEEVMRKDVNNCEDINIDFLFDSFVWFLRAHSFSENQIYVWFKNKTKDLEESEE